MAKKQPQGDAAADLAEKMIQVLAAQRSHAYPLSLAQLIRLSDATAPAGVVKKAINKKTFANRVVVARRGEPEAPVALMDDLALLAGSHLLLEFMLRSVRNASNHAFTVAELKNKTSSKLQKPFQEALAGQIEKGTLPPTVGWILNRSKKLLLMEDLHTTRAETLARELPTIPAAADGAAVQGEPVSAMAFAPAFDEVFDRLDRQDGSHNFVSLVDLRHALPLSREHFDAGLHQLRLAGRYSLSAAEGRHGIKPEERAAGIAEEGTLLLFVSRTSP